VDLLIMGPSMRFFIINDFYTAVNFSKFQVMKS
jgi:hypothetical protein